MKSFGGFFYLIILSKCRKLQCDQGQFLKNIKKYFDRSKVMKFKIVALSFLIKDAK